MAARLTLAEWTQIDEAARRFQEARDQLSRALLETACRHNGSDIASNLVDIESTLWSTYPPSSLLLQTTWCGNDRNGEPIFRKREPNCVNIPATFRTE